ncbi:MAG: hypothetical protein R6V17_06410 [Halanaerobacter sp.]
MRNRQQNLLLNLVIIFAAGILLPSNLVLASSIEKEELIRELDLKENTEIIQIKDHDVTGDGSKDRVFLTGVKQSSRFFDHLRVSIKQKETKEYTKASCQDFSGYEPQLQLKDFSGDQVADIMIKAPTGGSGGIVNHLIVSFKDAQPEVIFDEEDNQGVAVTGQFLPGFRTRLEFKEIAKEVVFDLNFKKERYIKDKIYNSEGQLVKRKLIRPDSYPFNNLTAIDLDQDGTYELKGYQKVVGAYGADMISRLESNWDYQDGEWRLIDLIYSSYTKLK